MKPFKTWMSSTSCCLVILFTSGCASNADYAAERQRAFDELSTDAKAQCLAFGHRRQTPEWAECVERRMNELSLARYGYRLDGTGGRPGASAGDAALVLEATRPR